MPLTVLAVDDSRTIRDMIRMALPAPDFDVVTAEDGEDGLETLKTMQPDVMITDINMPKLDGFGFIEGARASEAHRGVPILVLTTESAPALRARAKAAGATGWIVKPFDREKLVATIKFVAA